LRLAWGRINEIYGDNAFSAIVLLVRTFARSMPVNGPRKLPARLTQTECLLWSEQMEGFGVTCAAAAEMLQSILGDAGTSRRVHPAEITPYIWVHPDDER
jgi:hypothetical protein